MPKQSKLTEKMLTAAYFHVDPANRTHRNINAWLEQNFGVTVGRTRYQECLREWNIHATVMELSRSEAHAAVAKAMVGEEVTKLNSQIGSLNKAEEIVGKLLDMAQDVIDKTKPDEDLDTAGQALTIAQELMKTSSMVRKEMADIGAGLGKPDGKPDDMTNVVPITPADVARYQAS